MPEDEKNRVRIPSNISDIVLGVDLNNPDDIKTFLGSFVNVIGERPLSNQLKAKIFLENRYFKSRLQLLNLHQFGFC
jgi:hypothetical protein